MKKSRSTLALFAFAAALVLAHPALAQDGMVFYFGGSFLKPQAKEDICQQYPAMTCDRQTERAWGAMVGLMFNRNWGVEAGYRNLGKVVEQSDAATGQRRWVRTRLGEFVGVGSYPIAERWAVFGKFGGYVAKSRLTSSFEDSDTSSTHQWTSGLGVQYNPYRYLGLRLEWQRYNNLGGKEVGFRTDVDAIGLGALVRF